MRFEAWITAAWLASTASAIGPGGPVQRLAGKPEKMANWKWPNPFTSPHIKKFDAACSAERTFEAAEFVLDDLAEKPPAGLLPYRDALRGVFAAREYPGSWDGVDPHGYDRHLLMMDYDAMPLRVREWIEDQERSGGAGRGLFAVYARPAMGTHAMDTIKIPEAPVSEEWRQRDDRRVALFAPGALYEVLPLFVAEGSACEETLLDTSKYSGELRDGGVVAYPINHTSPKRSKGRRDIEFTVKAQVLKLKPGEDAPEDVHQTVEKTEGSEDAEKDKPERTEKAKTSKSEGVEGASKSGKDEL
ncbi:hypothetical protein VTK56DRAFT_5858 [Thermocarpiscus australiensis]